MNIMISLPMTQAHKEQFLAAAPGHTICFEYENASDAFLAETRVSVGRLPLDKLAKMPNLEFVQLCSAGVGIYNTAVPRQIPLANASGAFGAGIAEHALGMVLMLMKKLHCYLDEQHNRNWSDFGEVTSPMGAKVLVIGLGNLGREFAWRMHALGSEITAVKRTPGNAPEYVSALYTMEKLDDCLAQADVVYLALPDTAATAGLFDRQRLEKMKPGAILVNVGRGNAVDLDALCDLLEVGRLGGAALDVTDPEPLPSQHRAWGIPNLLITPHVSGGFHLAYTHNRIVEICADNLGRFVRGEKLENLVDRDTGY